MYTRESFYDPKLHVLQISAHPFPTRRSCARILTTTDVASGKAGSVMCLK